MHTQIRPGELIPHDRYFIALRDTRGVLHLFGTPQDVLAALAPDYLSRGTDEQSAFRARHELARAFIAAGHERLDADDVESLTEDERMALSARGARPVTEVAAWTAQVPLYVLATLHRPYASVPLPEGDGVCAVDPYTEASLVTSLADAGLIDAWPVQAGQLWDGTA